MYDAIKEGKMRSRSNNKEKEVPQPQAAPGKPTYSSASGISSGLNHSQNHPYDNKDSKNSHSTSSSKWSSSAPHSQSYHPTSGFAYKSADYGHQERPSKTRDAEPLKELPCPKETYENTKHAQQGSSNSGGSEWYRNFDQFFGDYSPFQ
ncbi:unnamed protein product [Acanthoscelides obtectus]|uniref:Uncharacterized protein n=1 Tax=Acanthoscelides obtectus TaxID=200917 RepID=A0A9P0KXJ3_ACAOB|nr:unnamed protein product [Acanthoscelides obtectus]CAK1654559.1 hypothetical protein AOBTE_LOCUS18675 [Acanthoscelides obtectus]